MALLRFGELRGSKTVSKIIEYAEGGEWNVALGYVLGVSLGTTTIGYFVFGFLQFVVSKSKKQQTKILSTPTNIKQVVEKKNGTSANSSFGYFARRIGYWALLAIAVIIGVIFSQGLKKHLSNRNADAGLQKYAEEKLVLSKLDEDYLKISEMMNENVPVRISTNVTLVSTTYIPPNDIFVYRWQLLKSTDEEDALMSEYMNRKAFSFETCDQNKGISDMVNEINVRIEFYGNKMQQLYSKDIIKGSCQN
ncbi:hypothetical protein C1J05_09960 [Sulfitobacter sp. JL08]|nr:hypothetical protein C1J05_09960 [Sulfitobacter sp. JL08]